MLKRFASGLCAAALMCATPALAGPAADTLRTALYAGTLTAGVDALTPMAAGGDQEAKFGLGMLQMVMAVEGVAQALYRHGLSAPETGPLGPVLGMPVPANATPEQLDYAKFRAVLSALVDGMDAARDTMLSAGESGDYVVLVDPLQVRVDVNGDGKADPAEAVAAVVQMAFGGDPSMAMPSTPAEPNGTTETPPAEPVQIGFDRADAIWLAGYSQVIAGQADYFLAHDFSEFFNAVFHRLFPRAGLMMQQYATGGMLMMDPETDTVIADLVAAIHTLNWPVVEPDRLKRVLARAQTVTQLSRKNWEAILAETDDQNELVPSPTQTAISGDKITTEMVAAWHDTLDAVDKVLAGELLVPHWRFKEGFDLKAYFETATRTDLVMLLTGAGAIPYLKAGPLADAETFAAANRVFGDNLIGYAFWFN